MRSSREGKFRQRAERHAGAWEEVPDGELRDLLHYVATGCAEGLLSRDIERLVTTYNEDRKWVNRVLTVEWDTLIRCKRAKEEGREEGIEELGALVRSLLQEGRIEDAERVTCDAAFRNKLMEEMRA